MSYIYLASPYSHPDAAERHRRYLAVRAMTAWMLSHRLWVYSPIVHCHDLANAHGLPTDFDFWRDYNRAMLKPAEMLYVLQLPGWQESKGVAGEIALAEKYKKPVIMLADHLTPATEGSHHAK